MSHRETAYRAALTGVILLSLICQLSGCFGMAPNPGLQNERSFTQDSTKPYIEACKTIAKQMRACDRAIDCAFSPGRLGSLTAGRPAWWRIVFGPTRRQNAGATSASCFASNLAARR
jgi:hypothetical protein